MIDLRLHLSPHAPWPGLLLLSALVVLLGAWIYRIAVPPLPRWARRLLPALRVIALLVLVWLLGQPVLDRTAGGRPRVVVLVDQSASMDLPVAPGGEPRSRAAARAAMALERAWRGRAAIELLRFDSRLEADSAHSGAGRGVTALGDALEALASGAAGQGAGAVIVASDGAVNAGDDPVTAGRALGVPVHAIVVGQAGPDRVVTEVESPDVARVGRPVTVEVRLTSTEERGVPMTVRLTGDGRELGRATVVAPGSGAEASVVFHVVPARAGLAIWTASVDSLGGELTPSNNAREIALEVAPGRLGVLIVSAGLNWDLTFLRRALLGDSSLAVSTFTRERSGWRADLPGPHGVERDVRGDAPSAADLRGETVVILDALAPPDVSPAFDRGLAEFARSGGGLLLLGGPAPGISRFRSGTLGTELAITLDPAAVGRGGHPAPAPEAHDLLAWDDDAARGGRAWRAAAPLTDLVPVRPGPGDRVLVGSAGDGPPLLFARHIGRGQALFVNGTGIWRWSLSGADELTAERGRTLWRRLCHWLAEPVQAEPLRVRPERWLAAGGEPV
ncbi:MAG TPA: hypothetical protein VMS88_07600, partial [Terriglobales bacterium]|nr:hypothetical protein [Terriglobales bacterium]